MTLQEAIESIRKLQKKPLSKRKVPKFTNYKNTIPDVRNK